MPDQASVRKSGSSLASLSAPPIGMAANLSQIDLATGCTMPIAPHLFGEVGLWVFWRRRMTRTALALFAESGSAADRVFALRWRMSDACSFLTIVGAVVAAVIGT